MRKNANAKGVRPSIGTISSGLKGAQRDWERGVALVKAGEWLEAEVAFRQASDAAPRDVLYLLNLARAQLQNGALEGAGESARRIIALEPGNALAHTILARALHKQRRHAEAAAVQANVPAQAPRDAAYYQDLGEYLFNAGQYKEAISALFEALGRNIDHALSHFRLGLSFNALGLKKEATECLRTALVLGMGQGNAAAQSLVAFIEREVCRWDHARDDVEVLRDMVRKLPQDVVAWISVFAQVTLTDVPQEHLIVARACARFHGHGIQALPRIEPHPIEGRLRVGFVSSDLHQHATAALMAEVFEKLDRTRFEVVLYSHGPEDGSAMRERMKQAGERFVEVSKLSDRDVAQMIRNDRIDVLVDLKGHTRDGRLGIFAYRPAPVQATYLGFPGTTGADYMDYFIGDAIVSPLSHAAHFSEKLALLPRCYQANDRQRALPQAMSRAEAGLPEDVLVLCGFNQPFKLSPDVFDVWCRLLTQLPGSVLWLLQWNDQAPEHLRKEAAARGVDPARLIFAPKVGARQHLSRFALADIYLDAWPCNGHTTVSDALWAGVPVVSYAGESFASRVGASLLHAVGLADYATDKLPDYEARVMTLAQDAGLRATVRQHLVDARDQAELFDSTGFTKDFGDLLWQMADRWSKGLAPDHLIAAEGRSA